MNAVPQPALPAYPRLRRYAINAAITAVFNVAIALIVTYVIRLHGSFTGNLVISMCIGMLMHSFIDGTRLLLWGIGKPPLLPMIMLAAVAAPSARYLGNHIAAALLGIPPETIAAARGGNEIGFFVMFAFTFLAIAWFFWNRGKVEHLKAEAEAAKARAAAIEKQAMQAQLKMLQAQIEPHMLFNTLANLHGLIAVDPQRAQHMLECLIHYLRTTLSSSRSDKTSLVHEFLLTDAYLGLMKVRMGSRLSYTLDLPEALHNVSVPPMLLQPLVENAIKHGLEPKVDGGGILIRAERSGNDLVLTVADTGLGLEETRQANAGTGIGVSNVRERLQALFGTRASFDLLPNQPAGALARLRIPL